MWEDRLSELADHRKIHGHCVPNRYSKTSSWEVGPENKVQVAPRRKGVVMTNHFRIGIGTLGFEWDLQRRLG
jgi:hypothetical protein